MRILRSYIITKTDFDKKYDSFKKSLVIISFPPESVIKQVSHLDVLAKCGIQALFFIVVEARQG